MNVLGFAAVNDSKTNNLLLLKKIFSYVLFLLIIVLECVPEYYVSIYQI